jgi:hypothetical protein
MARFRHLARDYERLAETLAGLHFVAFAIRQPKHFPSGPKRFPSRPKHLHRHGNTSRPYQNVSLQRAKRNPLETENNAGR